MITPGGPARPRIITFYSYKGGTGRSMALANIAWILASNGRRVIVIDWDLEAPGLHRYFHPFLHDKELSSSEGLIDFILDFASEAVTPDAEGRPDDWFVERANLLRYAASLDHQFPRPENEPSRPTGTVDFVPSGRQGPDYATRVNSFNWQLFYEKLGGGVFLEAAKRSLSDYDYVLIDSRTGVSDTSGICTIQMPDVLAVFFTLNTQSIEGAAAVAESVLAQRRKPNGEPGIRIFPVPSRVEFAEAEKLDLAREAAQLRFDGLLWHIPNTLRALYWGRVEVPYRPFYAYEEILATFADRPFQSSSVLAALEVVTEYITDGDVRKLPPLPEEQRKELLSRSVRKPERVTKAASLSPGLRYLFYFSYAPRDRDVYLKRFFGDLSTEVQMRTGREEAVGFFDVDTLGPGPSWSEMLVEALASSCVLVSICSPRYFASESAGKVFTVFLERVRSEDSELRSIIPVQWVPLREGLPAAFERLQMHSDRLPKVYREEGLWYLMKLHRHREAYQEVVSELAKAVVAAAKNPPPPLEKVLALQDVRSAFSRAPGLINGF